LPYFYFADDRRKRKKKQGEKEGKIDIKFPIRLVQHQGEKRELRVQ
jgi:hypothetical protein